MFVARLHLSGCWVCGGCWRVSCFGGLVDMYLSLRLTVLHRELAKAQLKMVQVVI